MKNLFTLAMGTPEDFRIGRFIESIGFKRGLWQ